MNTKQKVIYTYVGVALLFTIYLWLWGDMAHKGFFYNLGKGLFWPISIFPTLGPILGGIILAAVLFLIFAVG